MRIFLAILFIVLTIHCRATTWAAAYPYTQKTESGNVSSHSVPYGVYDGPYGPGETFVSANGKLLYTIDKYFSNPFFTANNGEYLIEVNLLFYYFITPNQIVPNSDQINTFLGNVINIYKNGIPLKNITLDELKIDPSKYILNQYRGIFYCNFTVIDTTKDKLKLKMARNSIFTEGNNLYLIAADNQLITIDMLSGEIINRQNAYETLKDKLFWKRNPIKRKYQKVKYPDQFLLPNLQSGETIEQGLAKHLNRKVSDYNRDSALIQIYIHTLLINKEGKCEEVSVSPTIRKDILTDFEFNYDKELKAEIEEWLRSQTFITSTFPKDFSKYKYTDFVYLQ